MVSEKLPSYSHSEEVEDDFEIIGDKLPLRPKSAPKVSSPWDVDVQLHPLPGQNSLLVSVIPPLKPMELKNSHVPVDIVLSIDVSGSMAASATLPVAGDTQVEQTGLSVLDLTKHAARTIIQTLNDKDRLGVVTFSSDAKVVFELSFMTEKNKKAVLLKIEGLQPEDMTNLWHGIMYGLKMLENAAEIKQNVQALYVLTDGKPNHMCPQQGYVPKLRPLLQDFKIQEKNLPSIHTFGFGYNIRSGLLQSIAEIGAGTYSFIPDAGMIGTVFVHAVSNLYTTFATQSKLTFRNTGSIILSQDEGSKVEIRLEETSSSPTSTEFSIQLGNLQYGQSRDILIHYSGFAEKSEPLQAKLTYNFNGVTKAAKSDAKSVLETTSLPVSVRDYHLYRTRVCSFLRSLSPLKADKEHYALPATDLPKVRVKLESLISDFQRLGHKDEQNTSLFQDLAGEDPQGQIRLALSKEQYYNRWGQHYLLSLLNAHTYQICNSFKDPGPLQYGKKSPLFIACRKELDNCFDNLPAPKPSIYVRGPSPNRSFLSGGHMRSVPTFSMSSYNRSSNPCFAGHCKIRLPNAKGTETIPIRDLRPGMAVWTPRGSRLVAAVVATAVQDIEICKIGSLSITPWHPMQSTQSSQWQFPWQISSQPLVPFSGTIYSVLLAPSSDPEAHAIMVGGRVCVTLGHGIRASGNEQGQDVRAHKFFGSYRRVLKSLDNLPRNRDGVLKCRGIKRSTVTGLASGFVGAGQKRLRVKRSKMIRGSKNLAVPL